MPGSTPSWLPIVVDPLCAVAGWLRLLFLECTAYMAVGKGVRCVVATAGLLRLWPGAYGGRPASLQ